MGERSGEWVAGDTGPMDSAPQGFPAIMFYLQKEWTRFEKERAKWNLERAELLNNIAALEGQQRANQNLNRDLLRRVKMLELALKHERDKSNPGTPSTPMEPLKQTPTNRPVVEGSVVLKEGRHLLLKYLNEMGCADQVIATQSARLKVLIESDPSMDTWRLPTQPTFDRLSTGLSNVSSHSFTEDEFVQEPAVKPLFQNSTKSLKHSPTIPPHHPTEKDALDTLDFLDDLDGETSTDEASRKAPDIEFAPFSDGEAEGQVFEEIPVRVSLDKRKSADKLLEAVDAIMPPDDIIATPVATPRTSPPRNVGNTSSPVSEEASSPISPTDGSEEEEDEEMRLLEAKFGKKLNKAMQGYSPKKKSGKRQLPPSPENVAKKPGNEPLGELAELSLSSPAPQAAPKSELYKELEARKQWKPKYTLKGHLDGVRSMAFHPSFSHLASASEDHTVCLWAVNTASRKSALDIEPVMFYRGHTSPVLSVALVSDAHHNLCFSGAADSTIKVWKVVPDGYDKTCAYDPSLCVNTYVGHSDAVWSLDIYRSLVLSSSADGTCKLWNMDSGSPLQATFRIPDSNALPTSAEFLKSDPTKIVVSYTDASCVLYDIQTTQQIISLPSKETSDGTSDTQINVVRSHPLLPLVATGHEEKFIRFFDIKSGSCAHSMVAHQDAVSSLCFDNAGMHLASGGHDRSLRIWEVSSKQCVFEVTSHRVKLNEAIHDVKFHPSLPLLASCGADGVIKLYV